MITLPPWLQYDLWRNAVLAGMAFELSIVDRWECQCLHRRNVE